MGYRVPGRSRFAMKGLVVAVGQQRYILWGVFYHKTSKEMVRRDVRSILAPGTERLNAWNVLRDKGRTGKRSIFCCSQQAPSGHTSVC